LDGNDRIVHIGKENPV